MISLRGKMGDIVGAYNDLVNGFQEHTSDIQWLKNKTADLEDRSRRNNFKFRGIPQSVTP